MPCVQILQIELRNKLDDSRTPTSDLQQLISLLKDAEGSLGTTWSLQAEDPKFAGVVTQWKSLEDLDEWKTSPSYSNFTALLGDLTSHHVYLDTVLFPQDTNPTLSAPVVELVSFLYQCNQMSSKLETKVAAGFADFADAITSGAPEAAGGLVGGWGQVEFMSDGVMSRRFTALIGWKNVEAHYKSKETAVFKDNIHHLIEHGHDGVEMVHYKWSSRTE